VFFFIDHPVHFATSSPRMLMVRDTCSLTDAMGLVPAAAAADAVDAVSVFGTAWFCVSDVAFTLCSSVPSSVDCSVCRRSPQTLCLLCSVRLTNA